MADKLRVGVLGAGKWAEGAHVPGWQRDPRCEVVVLCDPVADLARDFAGQFNIPEHTNDWQALVGRDDLYIIDVVKPTHTHY
jgi:predicted dehydrogenase